MATPRTRRPRILTVLVGLAVLAALTATGREAVHTWHPAHQPTKQVAPAAPDLSRTSVDVAVANTVIGAARLSAFEHAAEDRRRVVLDRARQDLAAAAAALAVIPPEGPVDQQAVTAAQDALSALIVEVDQVRTCLAPNAAHALRKRCTDPAAAAARVTQARTTGAAVAALVPEGTLSPERVPALMADVQAQARAEARAGSSSGVTWPAA